MIKIIRKDLKLQKLHKIKNNFFQLKLDIILYLSTRNQLAKIVHYLFSKN